MVGNHKDFCAAAMCCHPLEELQDCHNLLFAMITPAALISKCSAASPTQLSLICAAVGRHSTMAKIYTQKHYSFWYQHPWIELLPPFGWLISLKLKMYVDLYMPHENFFMNENTDWKLEQIAIKWNQREDRKIMRGFEARLFV